MALASRATGPARESVHRVADANGLAAIILMRVAAGGATRTEVTRDLKALAPDTAGLFKAALEAQSVRLEALGLTARTSARYGLTEAGVAAVARLIGLEPTSLSRPPISGMAWAQLRDGPLTLAALGADATDAKLVKSIQSPDALRAMVVQSAFGIGEGKPMSLGKLRTMLALRALERAFGGHIKTALGNGSALAAKPSRLLAAQLARRPKDPGSDAKLIALLAAEHLGVASAEPEVLRLALLKRWLSTRPEVEGAVAVAQPQPKRVMASSPGRTLLPDAPPPVAVPANDCGSLAEPMSRPDLPGFVRAVAAAAVKRADGWPGNRKAFICHVIDEVTAAYPHWGLSDIELKGMLAEAHRSGGLVLANADLKDKQYIQEFEKSAIQYKNTTWHFVRVDEP